jgi:hypothetical protein
MGEQPTETLFAHLPPVGWADVATKTDLEHLRAEIKADVDHLRSEMTSALANLATKESLQELRSDMERSMKEQTRTMIFGLAGLNATFLAALLAGARLIGA